VNRHDFGHDPILIVAGHSRLAEHCVQVAGTISQQRPGTKPRLVVIEAAMTRPDANMQQASAIIRVRRQKRESARHVAFAVTDVPPEPAILILKFPERSYTFDAFLGGLDNGFRPGAQLFNTAFDDRMTWAVGLFKKPARRDVLETSLGSFRH
jgi:hypothetical protein